MAFQVPPGRQGFYDDVIHRFRQLLQKGIVTGIDPIRLNNWLVNFVTLEDRYLAAHILSGLTYRSDAMVRSSFQHLVHCELPRVLRARGVLSLDDLESFDQVLSTVDQATPFRFVAVDGTFEKTPGKSGALLLRAFRRHLSVSKTLLCRPERLAELPTTVKALIFIDDLVGTGQQFQTFATHSKLADHAKQRALVYCPLLGFKTGLASLAKRLPWLEIQPVEILNESHQFFRPSEQDRSLWDVDGVNKVQDVHDHVAELCKRNAIPFRTNHCLDLVVAFENAAPNNSLTMLSSKSAQWQSLFDR
jgi:hypothetical protein